MSDPTVLKVLATIEIGGSFLVEAGAGSGKTWALVESLKYLLNTYGDVLRRRNQKVVCITYTNVAKDEIEERINHNELVEVGTIHEFLWSVIKNFQRELKIEILESEQLEDDDEKRGLQKALESKVIEYSQYGKNLLEGRITHSDVIRLAVILFEKYSKISLLTRAKYPFVFVDEYQDTEPSVVNLLLDKILGDKKADIVIGFFGDSMQKIYNQGVGTIVDERLTVVTKTENFRCSKSVIAVLNQIRPNLQQKPAGANCEGEAIFIHCNDDLENPHNFENTMKFLEKTKGWKVSSDTLKILMLTHKGIAAKLDYSDLLNVYSTLTFGRERLYERDDKFADLLMNKVEKLSSLYTENRYGELIDVLGEDNCRILKHSDKKRLKKLMDELIEIRKSGNIGDVLKYVFTNALVSKPTSILDFENRIKSENTENVKDKQFYETLIKIPYEQVVRLNKYIEESTPFSTKHGVKGAEFKNVLVVIDDTSWNQYNFNHVFCGASNKTQYLRSLNLLYVCCSRSIDKLAVLSLSKMDPLAISTANKWFGVNNVFSGVN